MKIATYVISLMLMYHFASAQNTQPLRIGIAGLTHTHVHWIFSSNSRAEFEIVGVAEPDRALAEKYFKQYSISMDLWFPTLEEMISKARPEAVTAFNSIFEHLEVVKICAPKGIHVMVEKPLAVNLEHAKEMQRLANANKILLMTNYETTWYRSNHLAYDMIASGKIGQLRKIVVNDGHRGPKEIGVSDEFLNWLTDPKKNGGGAIMDFGCYGADEVTWLMKNQRPETVMAVTQQFKPSIYPKVDDEATIIVTYPNTQAIIQASWNWPYNRKDIEIYGDKAYIKADRTSLEYREGDGEKEVQDVATPDAPYDNPFAYFASVIRGKITMHDNDLSALPLNMIAMEILEAANESARTGKRIYLSQHK